MSAMSPLLHSIHLILACLWVGGMFFAYMVLRPSAAEILAPPERLQLWRLSFKKFFPWVWMAILFLPLTGFLLSFNLYSSFFHAPAHVLIMFVLYLLMLGIFLYLFYLPYQKLILAVDEQNWSEAASHLAVIRKLVAINLALGLAILLVVNGLIYYL
jgi:uncharacterized membrane protein